MNRRRFLSAAACGCAIAGSGSLFGAPLSARMDPGLPSRPASEENGLWDQFGKEEQQLKRSRFLIRDPELNAYVASIACKVAGDFCRDLRVYVVRSPYFNATMAPNGMMQVWSGCLLRCQSEAQLAAILGHECGHYLRRHGLDRFRDAQQKSAFSTLMGLGLSLAGGARFAALGDAAVLASAFAFTRDQEREADTMGLDLCARAGYDPEEAANVWAHLVAERDARENQGFRDLVFATHPVEEEREETLRGLAKACLGAAIPRGAAGTVISTCCGANAPPSSPTSSSFATTGPSMALFGRCGNRTRRTSRSRSTWARSIACADARATTQRRSSASRRSARCRRRRSRRGARSGSCGARRASTTRPAVRSRDTWSSSPGPTTPRSSAPYIASEKTP
jgi:hypothetical protein